MPNAPAVAIIAAALLAACGQPAPAPPAAEEAPTPPALTIATDAAAGPSGVDALTWVFDHAQGSGRPRLMYRSVGVEGMALNLQCLGDEVQVALSRAGPAPEAWPFTLTSGEVSADLAGAPEGESEVVVRATLPANAPVLQHFTETGELSETDNGITTPMNAINDDERAAIRAFFEACR